jgi:alpha-1,3-glucan synthase
LPPYIFSGTEFVLIPSRDEPFGLVAVEFGRKGALGVGARVGGLGQMPGWWYMIESIATKHLIHQFKMAIRGALTSKKEVRALMRARSALQRFPVAQWVEDLEKLYSTSINVHHRQAARTSGMFGISRSGASTPFGSSAALAAHDTLLHNSSEQPNEPYDPARSKSLLSLYSVRGEGAKKDFNLQKVDPFFTDFTGLYYKTFQKMLNTVDAKSSEDQLCIEDYLTKSEKQWFGRFHLAKLGKSPSVSATPTSSVFNMRWSNRNPLSLDNWTSSADDGFSRQESGLEQFLLDDDYISPKGLRKLLQRKIGDWQIYSFLLAFVSTPPP